MTAWKTRLATNTTAHYSNSSNWNCQIPIVGAPMAGHAGGKLAAAVCRAGGLGFIGAGHWCATTAGLEQLRQEIDVFRAEQDKYTTTDTDTATTYPLCLGFIGHSTFRDSASWERFADVLQTYKPAVVQFFAPAVVVPHPDDTLSSNTTSNVALAQLHQAKVLAQVGTVREALEAVHTGVDGLIVQGSEAGGHGVRRELGNGTLSLAATVMAKLRATTAGSEIPVIAAGGIVDGNTMAAALALGCDGVVLGTRLWAAQESIGLQQFKDRLVAAESCDDVVRTTTFDCIQNTYSATPWPEPFDSAGALRNETCDAWDGRSAELSAALQKADSTLVPEYRHACAEGNADIALVHAGEGVGLIDAIEPAYDIVTRISEDAANVISNLPKKLLDE